MHADLGDRLVRGLVRGGVWPRACGLEEPMICRGFAVTPAIPAEIAHREALRLPQPRSQPGLSHP